MDATTRIEVLDALDNYHRQLGNEVDRLFRTDGVERGTSMPEPRYQAVEWPPGGHTVAVHGRSNAIGDLAGEFTHYQCEQIAKAMNVAYERGKVDRSEEICMLLGAVSAERRAR